MVIVKVKLFANLREAAGSDVLHLDFHKSPTISEALEAAIEKAPTLRRFLSCEGKFNEQYKVLVGYEVVFPEAFSRTLLDEEAAIAILPPVSGG